MVTDASSLHLMQESRTRLKGVTVGRLETATRRGLSDRSLGLRQTGSVATAIISPAKNALTQKNTRISSAFFMASPLFEITSATVARRRRSCNHLPVTGLGQY